MLILLFILFLIAFYFYSTKNHDYWRKRNVKHDPPIPLFGNHLRNQIGIKSRTEISVELYNKYPNEKVIGYYKGTTPELIVKDLDLVRRILTVDFAYFSARGLGRDPKTEPLQGNLFQADGDLWRFLRQKFTPAFTTAKLRAMFPLIVACAELLQKACMDKCSNNNVIDAKDMMARFSTDFIGACGFGIEMDSINNERSQFRELGRMMLTRSLKSRILLPIWELFPEIRKWIYVNDKVIEENITAIVKNIREQRNFKPTGRKDFIDLLLELENEGMITLESIEKTNPDGSPMQVELEMDLNCMAAQVYLFYFAGFETSSSATSHTLHQLAYHPELQKEVQKEIDEVLSKYDNKLCYDAISEMSLLNMTLKEGLRIFPSLGVLNRGCTRKYEIPDLNITIDPGVKILIPVQAIHTDEKYWDDPLEFRPDRFTTESEKGRHNFAYLPFGEGPRACVGARMGQMQSTAGLAAILQKFTLEPAPITRKEINLDRTSVVVQCVNGGLPLRFKLREK